MDIITQRFIAIGNRLIAELRLLRNGIEKLVGAVHDAEEAQNQQRQQEPPVVRAELQIPEAIERERAKPDERHYRVQVWLAVATTLAFVAAAIYAGLTYWQANTTQELARIAKEQTRISVRPWIGVSDDPKALQFSAVEFDQLGNAEIKWGILTKNYGSSGAQNVFVFAQLLVTEDIDRINRSENESCRMVGDPRMGDVSFPGKREFGQTMFSDYPKGEMVSKSGDGKLEAWIVGCIGYRDQFGYLYHTLFKYWLVQPEGVSEPVRVDPIPNTKVGGVWQAYDSSLQCSPSNDPSCADPRTGKH
jgi:hypothetical protein